MGVGTLLAKPPRLSALSSESVVPDMPRIGTMTPHSQLRQLSFGCFVVLSCTNRPLPQVLGPRLDQRQKQKTHQALSERFALPTYTHAAHRVGLDFEHLTEMT